MSMTKPAVVLRVFTDAGARNGCRPLHEDIVLKARKAKLAGVTVLRGIMGYGRSAELRWARPLDLAPKLPLVVEIVDSEEKLRAFLPTLNGMRDLGLVTWEPLEAIEPAPRRSRERGA